MIRYIEETDKPYWFTLDRDMKESEFSLKVRDKRGYVICDGNIPIGIMRYNLFWDVTPFLTLIAIEEACRGKGFGKDAILSWENEMRKSGYGMVMISTQADEQAQYFYRKLGYKDNGGLFWDNEAPELFMVKLLRQAE